jgi:hypothetical protein
MYFVAIEVKSSQVKSSQFWKKAYPPATVYRDIDEIGKNAKITNKIK